MRSFCDAIHKMNIFGVVLLKWPDITELMNIKLCQRRTFEAVWYKLINFTIQSYKISIIATFLIRLFAKFIFCTHSLSFVIHVIYSQKYRKQIYNKSKKPPRHRYRGNQETIWRQITFTQAFSHRGAREKQYRASKIIKILRNRLIYISV